MKRVVITGMGIVSSIGNNTQEVLASLHEAKSGITRAGKYAEMGFRSQVQGAPTLNPSDVIDRRAMRFLGEGAAWNHIAMEQAIRDSGLVARGSVQRRHRHHHGPGGTVRRGPSCRRLIRPGRRSPSRAARSVVPAAMSSMKSATLANGSESGGSTTSFSSACSTAATYWECHERFDGQQDLVFAGGGEEFDWTPVAVRRHGRDVREIQRHSGKTSDRTSKPRWLRHCRRRRHGRGRGTGARQGAGREIYAEIVGYGATSDGFDMVAPSGEGAVRCMRMAISTVEDLIRSHQPAWHRDADGRFARDRGDPRGVRRRPDLPADHGDQGADPPLARRRRCPGVLPIRSL